MSLNLGIEVGEWIEHTTTGSISVVEAINNDGVIVRRDDLPGETLLPQAQFIEALEKGLLEIG